MDLKILIIGFITILVGLILLGSVGDLVYENTNIASVPNDTITITSSAGTLPNSDILTVTNLENYSDDYASQIDDALNFTEAGAITTWDNLSDGTYFISYTHEPPLYVSDSTSRNLMPLITLFFALAVVALGIVIVSKSGIF